MNARILCKAKRLVLGIMPLYLFTSLPISAQEITRMSPGRTPDGLVYFLPKTAVRFNLLVEKKTYTPGRFARYADKYMRIPNIEQEPQTSFRVAQYELTLLGVRDTSKCFSVKMKGGKFETADVKLSTDGVLQAINATPQTPVVRPPFKAAPKQPAVDPQKYLSAEVLAASNLGKMAELTAQQIIELQEDREQLITGDADETPQDDEQLYRMLKEIDQERDALMSLFVGTVTRDTTEHVITICPDREVQQEVIFRLSSRLGLVDKDDLSGTPFYMSIQNLTPAPYGIPENKKQEGLYVNKPSMIRLTLYQDDIALDSFDLPMAQFGFMELRDASLFKRYDAQLRLSPITGAVDFLRADTSGK